LQPFDGGRAQRQRLRIAEHPAPGRRLRGWRLQHA
jgi:hypothetical protein